MGAWAGCSDDEGVVPGVDDLLVHFRMTWRVGFHREVRRGLDDVPEDDNRKEPLHGSDWSEDSHSFRGTDVVERLWDGPEAL